MERAENAHTFFINKYILFSHSVGRTRGEEKIEGWAECVIDSAWGGVGVAPLPISHMTLVADSLPYDYQWGKSEREERDSAENNAFIERVLHKKKSIPSTYIRVVVRSEKYYYHPPRFLGV